MTLTKNTWHYKFWMLNFGTYGKEPGVNFCDYFWSLILALVTLPLTWICLIIKTILRDYSLKFWQTVVIGIVLNLLLALVLSLGVICFSNSIILAGLVGSGTAVAVILYSVIWLVAIFPGTKIAKEATEIGKVAKEGFSSFKGKYCPKIEWNDIKEEDIEKQPNTLNYE